MLHSHPGPLVLHYIPEIPEIRHLLALLLLLVLLLHLEPLVLHSRLAPLLYLLDQ